MTTEVIIVGAGPAGLATALELVRLGKRVRIVGADAAPTTESRATGVLPRTLDLLEASGATDRMIAAGVRMKGVRVVSGGRTRALIDATRLQNRFNFMLSLPQSRTEAILSECLAERGVEIKRAREVKAIMHSAHSACAVVEGAGREECVTADWQTPGDLLPPSTQHHGLISVFVTHQERDCSRRRYGDLVYFSSGGNAETSPLT